MLRHIYDDLYRVIKDDEQRLISYMINGDNISTQLFEDIKTTFAHCESALVVATSVDQYNDVLEVIDAWTFYLASHGLSIPVKKDRKKPFFSSSFEHLQPDQVAHRSPGRPEYTDGEYYIQYSQNGRIINGVALQDSKDKTAKISVSNRYKHRSGKYISRSKNYLVHDDFNIVARGDIIEAIECRPISKKKKFILTKIEKRYP